MSERFLKIIISDQTIELAKKHKNAFVLLFFIAERARRNNDGLDGLQIGDAILGDYMEMGFSRKEYRTALTFLKKEQIIQSVQNQSVKNSLRMKNQATSRATKRAIKGEVVNLCDAGVYDINSNDKGHVKGHKKGHERATSGPQTRKKKKEKEENKEKVKKENFEISEKIELAEELIAVRENIKLTSAQLEKLKQAHPAEKLEWLFNRLDSWMTTKEGPFTARWCYGQLKPGGWPSNEYDEKLKTIQLTKQSPVNEWQNNEKRNRDLAEKILREYSSPFAEIEITANAISFQPTVGADTTPTVINFKENGFADRVDSQIRKKGFTKKIEPINENANVAVN